MAVASFTRSRACTCRNRIPSGVDASPAGEASAPDGILFLHVHARDRVKLATAIELLIDALDALDPEPDLEPMLGAPERPPQPSGFAGYSRQGSQRHWAD